LQAIVSRLISERMSIAATSRSIARLLASMNVLVNGYSIARQKRRPGTRALSKSSSWTKCPSKKVSVLRMSAGKGRVRVNEARI
jgi:hypothetical protein